MNIPFKGLTVTYHLTDDDVSGILRQRTFSTASPLKYGIIPYVGGEVVGIVTSIDPNLGTGIHLLLDGPDTYWILASGFGPDVGQWCYLQQQQD